MSQIKNAFLKTLVILGLSLVGSAAWAGNFYSNKINNIGGKPMDLNTYKGKPVLLVNIATKCGYTPQLEGLESLHKKYKDKGLVVVGIPSNDFGGQTPENNADVKKFCKLNYGVTFPLTEKSVVQGEKKIDLIKNLIAEADDKSEIGWNFEKFLIDKNGKLVGRFSSAIKPESKQLEDKIQSVL